MARRDQSNARKLELVNELSRQREQIKHSKAALVQQLAGSLDQIKATVNIPKLLGNKIQSSFRSHPTKWFIASTVGGLLISRFILSGISGRTIESSVDHQKRSSGIFLSAIGYVARPLIKSYLMGRLQRMIAERFLSHQQGFLDEEYPPRSDYEIY